MNKEDRRVKRTHKLLTRALIELSLKNGYDSVSIRDITQHADISYSTFFRHFADKESLLVFILKTLVDELRQIITSNPNDDPERHGTLIFTHVQQNESLYRVLLGSQGSADIFRHVHRIIVQEIVRDFEPRTDAIVPPDVAANHIAVSIFGLIRWWLNNAMPYPPERMGQIYSELIMKPAGRLSFEMIRSK